MAHYVFVFREEDPLLAPLGEWRLSAEDVVPLLNFDHPLRLLIFYGVSFICLSWCQHQNWVLCRIRGRLMDKRFSLGGWNTRALELFLYDFRTIRMGIL